MGVASPFFSQFIRKLDEKRRHVCCFKLRRVKWKSTTWDIPYSAQAHSPRPAKKSGSCTCVRLVETAQTWKYSVFRIIDINLPSNRNCVITCSLNPLIKKGSLEIRSCTTHLCMAWKMGFKMYCAIICQKWLTFVFLQKRMFQPTHPTKLIFNVKPPKPSLLSMLPRRNAHGKTMNFSTISFLGHTIRKVKFLSKNSILT